jgi:hypothetical protein
VRLTAESSEILRFSTVRWERTESRRRNLSGLGQLPAGQLQGAGALVVDGTGSLEWARNAPTAPPRPRPSSRWTPCRDVTVCVLVITAGNRYCTGLRRPDPVTSTAQRDLRLPATGWRSLAMPGPVVHHLADEVFRSFVHEFARSPQRSEMLDRLRHGHVPDPHGWCEHPAHAHRWERFPCSTRRLADLVAGVAAAHARLGTPRRI